MMNTYRYSIPIEYLPIGATGDFSVVSLLSAMSDSDALTAEPSVQFICSGFHKPAPNAASFKAASSSWSSSTVVSQNSLEQLPTA